MIVTHLILYIPVNFILMRYRYFIFACFSLPFFGLVRNSNGLLCLFSLVKATMNKRSEDLPWWQHVVITLSLLLLITTIVLLFVAVDFASGEGFSVVLNLTGGIAGMSSILPASNERLHILSTQTAPVLLMRM